MEVEDTKIAVNKHLLQEDSDEIKQEDDVPLAVEPVMSEESPESPSVSGLSKSSVSKNKKMPLKLNIPTKSNHDLKVHKPSTAEPMRIAVFVKDRKLDEGRRMLELENGKYTTAGQVKEKMLDNLSIPKSSAHLFAIWFISPYLELQLKCHHVPYVLRKQWGKLLQELSTCPKGDEHLDEPVLVFQRNSFITVEEEEKETEHNVLKRLFEEASQNVLKARYPLPTQTAEILGGILLNIYEGKFDHITHRAGVFKKRLSEFLPYYAIGSNKITQYIRSSGAEQRLLDQYQRASNRLSDKLSCYKEFLSHCRQLDFYGCAFFKGSVYHEGADYKIWKADQQMITIGVNRRGITLFKKETEEVLVHFYFDDFSWDYKKDEEDLDEDGNPIEWFIIEYDYTASECRQIQIISKQACLMDAMVQSCVNFMSDITSSNKEKADYKKIRDISYTPKTTGIRTDNNFTLTRVGEV